MRTRSDSSRPWSPEEVEVGFADVTEAIEDGVAALKSLGEEAATRKNEYDREKSKLMLATLEHPELKSAELREAWVFDQISHLKLAADIAMHLAKSQARTLDGLETQADLLRSANSKHRQMTQHGWGGDDRPPQRHREREPVGEFG